MNQSAKAAAASPTEKKERTRPLGGALETGAVLRMFPKGLQNETHQNAK
jgi:hypothetical protein